MIRNILIVTLGVSGLFGCVSHDSVSGASAGVRIVVQSSDELRTRLLSLEAEPNPPIEVEVLMPDDVFEWFGRDSFSPPGSYAHRGGYAYLGKVENGLPYLTTIRLFLDPVGIASINSGDVELSDHLVRGAGSVLFLSRIPYEWAIGGGWGLYVPRRCRAEALVALRAADLGEDLVLDG